MDWGFSLSDVNTNVVMRHSKADTSVPFVTAELNAMMLPECRLEARKDDPHFSSQVLDEFIRTEMTGV